MTKKMDEIFQFANERKRERIILKGNKLILKNYFELVNERRTKNILFFAHADTNNFDGYTWSGQAHLTYFLVVPKFLKFYFV